MLQLILKQYKKFKITTFSFVYVKQSTQRKKLYKEGSKKVNEKQFKKE